LFNIYETYLAKGDISDTESENEISFSDEFTNNIDTRIKTPIKSRVSRRISCFADIQSKDFESRKSLSRESTPNGSQQSVDDLNEISIPYDLNEMNEKEIIDLINKLNEDLCNKESNYPEMAALHMKEKFDKQIDFFNNISNDSENRFRIRSQQINQSSDQHKTPYHLLLAKELKDIQSKYDQIKKLISELKIIREICQK
jgi:YbbR domain-containing protein